jgi:prevent-host-death family protein
MSNQHDTYSLSASNTQIPLEDVIQRVAIEQKPIVLERNGTPVVVVLSLKQYEQLLQKAGLSVFEHLCQAAGQDALQQGLTEEQVVKEMEEIKQQLYQELYG